MPHDTYAMTTTSVHTYVTELLLLASTCSLFRRGSVVNSCRCCLLLLKPRCGDTPHPIPPACNPHTVYPTPAHTIAVPVPLRHQLGEDSHGTGGDGVLFHPRPNPAFLQDESQITKFQTGGPDGDLGSNEILISKDNTVVTCRGKMANPGIT